MNKARFAELFDLPPAERLEIAQDLWDSVAPHPDSLPPPTDEQIAEAVRRLEEHDKDPSTAIPWEEVRAALWARLK
ncbi:MAG: addiction module protein [Xanthobacteraceae bacterium]|jgi:putative addiction module component (TIGR02574 family)